MIFSLIHEVIHDFQLFSSRYHHCDDHCGNTIIVMLCFIHFRIFDRGTDRSPPDITPPRRITPRILTPRPYVPRPVYSTSAGLLIPRTFSPKTHNFKTSRPFGFRQSGREACCSVYRAKKRWFAVDAYNDTLYTKIMTFE